MESGGVELFGQDLDLVTLRIDFCRQAAAWAFLSAMGSADAETGATDPTMIDVITVAARPQPGPRPPVNHL